MSGFGIRKIPKKILETLDAVAIVSHTMHKSFVFHFCVVLTVRIPLRAWRWLEMCALCVEQPQQPTDINVQTPVMRARHIPRAPLMESVFVFAFVCCCLPLTG